MQILLQQRTGPNNVINESISMIDTIHRIRKVRHLKESISPDILPKAGAGQDGTDTLVKSYTRDTPGQAKKKVKSFKNYMN